LVLALMTAANLWAESASLEFRVGGQRLGSIDLQQLQDRLESRHVKIFNYMMGKEKRYQGFRLRDVLDLAFGDRWRSDTYSDIAFTALDGYEAVSPLEKLREKGAFLVFRDLDTVEEGWEPIGYKQANPGPFFLIWSGELQTTAEGYPWPWQIAQVDLLRFEQRYPAVVPAGAAENSAVYRGYRIFRARCLRCHAMDLQGGRIGPDLNAPQGITAYRSEYMIKEIIRHPSKYRHTQMPDHPDLSDRDLDDLYRYFLFQWERKTRSTAVSEPASAPSKSQSSAGSRDGDLGAELQPRHRSANLQSPIH